MKEILTRGGFGDFLEIIPRFAEAFFNLIEDLTEDNPIAPGAIIVLIITFIIYLARFVSKRN